MPTQIIDEYRTLIEGLIREATSEELSLEAVNSLTGRLRDLYKKDKEQYWKTVIDCYDGLTREMGLDGNRRVGKLVPIFMFQAMADEVLVR